MNKAEEQGSNLVEQFLNDNLSLELAKRKAIESVQMLQHGITTIRGYELTMKNQLDHLADVREVINQYQIPLADEQI